MLNFFKKEKSRKELEDVFTVLLPDNAVLLTCGFFSVFLRQLLLYFELFVYPFGLICGLLGFWLMSPRYFVSS
jgi:uncharacterized membrane protein YqaE (UPF0057 family)